MLWRISSADEACECPALGTGSVALGASSSVCLSVCLSKPAPFLHGCWSVSIQNESRREKLLLLVVFAVRGLGTRSCVRDALPVARPKNGEDLMPQATRSGGGGAQREFSGSPGGPLGPQTNLCWFLNKKSLLEGIATSLSPFCGSFQAAALVPSFLSRHKNACFSSPACFNPATVSLSPSICDKIPELEEGFTFTSFVFWIFCPGNLNFNVLAPSSVVEHNTHDLLSPLAPASSVV